MSSIEEQNKKVLEGLGLAEDPTVYAAQTTPPPEDAAVVDDPPAEPARKVEDVTIPAASLKHLSDRRDWAARDAVRKRIWDEHRTGRGGAWNKELWRHIDGLLDAHFDALEAGRKAAKGNGHVKKKVNDAQDARVEVNAEMVAAALTQLDDKALAALGLVRNG